MSALEFGVMCVLMFPVLNGSLCSGVTGVEHEGKREVKVLIDEVSGGELYIYMT
jgi:hypothetical protein